jgi:hypothetical protein
MTFVDLLNHDDYEILNEYPFTIRKKENGKVITEHEDDGYIKVHLNLQNYSKHRLIALQFIPNPDPARLTCVDHINRNRSDNHIENLRWVTISENVKNKTSHLGVEYEYLEDDEIPDDLIIVTDYGTHQFEDYYYSPSLDRFMFWNGAKTRLLHINYKITGAAFVVVRDTNNVRLSIFYTKFKKLYGLH